MAMRGIYTFLQKLPQGCTGRVVIARQYGTSCSHCLCYYCYRRKRLPVETQNGWRNLRLSLLKNHDRHYSVIAEYEDKQNATQSLCDAPAPSLRSEAATHCHEF